MIRAAICILLALCLATAGCSLVFVDGPPPARERRRDFDCTSGSVLPIVDVTLSVVGMLALVAAAAGPGGALGGTHTSHVFVGAGGLAVAGLGATSAGIGFARISACQDAKATAP